MQTLPVIGVVAAVIAGGCALYANSQIDKLNRLRGDVSHAAGRIDTAVGALGGQTAAVDTRVQALRAVAATPEMPVTGAQLQLQIDRLVALQAQAAAMAADDPGQAARSAAADLHDQAAAVLDALRNSPDRDAYGRALEMAGVADQVVFEITMRAAVAQSEGLTLAMGFDPLAQSIDSAHYRSATYDAAAVADALTYSALTAAQKAPLRAALAAAEGDEVALQQALDRIAAALGLAPAQ